MREQSCLLRASEVTDLQTMNSVLPGLNAVIVHGRALRSTIALHACSRLPLIVERPNRGSQTGGLVLKGLVFFVKVGIMVLVELVDSSVVWIRGWYWYSTGDSRGISSS